MTSVLVLPHHHSAMATTRQEAEATERRLRPVYGEGMLLSNFPAHGVKLGIHSPSPPPHALDAIDNGQNKKVIQLVEKILKKQPGLNCAKVWCVGVRKGAHSQWLSPPGPEGHSFTKAWESRGEWGAGGYDHCKQAGRHSHSASSLHVLQGAGKL